jgi:hypothetical protein
VISRLGSYGILEETLRSKWAAQVVTQTRPAPSACLIIFYYVLWTTEVASATQGSRSIRLMKRSQRSLSWRSLWVLVHRWCEVWSCDSYPTKFMTSRASRSKLLMHAHNTTTSWKHFEGGERDSVSLGVVGNHSSLRVQRRATTHPITTACTQQPAHEGSIHPCTDPHSPGALSFIYRFSRPSLYHPLCPCPRPASK